MHLINKHGNASLAATSQAALLAPSPQQAPPSSSGRGARSHRFTLIGAVLAMMIGAMMIAMGQASVVVGGGGGGEGIEGLSHRPSSSSSSTGSISRNDDANRGEAGGGKSEARGEGGVARNTVAVVAPNVNTIADTEGRGGAPRIVGSGAEGEEEVTTAAHPAVAMVDTAVVDTPSTILYSSEAVRLRRLAASHRTDFPQHDRRRYLSAVKRKDSSSGGGRIEGGGGAGDFHPSLAAWATTRYKVAEVPHTHKGLSSGSDGGDGGAGAASSSSSAKRGDRLHLRYPMGPPALYQHYSSPAEVNALYASYGRWGANSMPEEREEWGRWSPSPPSTTGTAKAKRSNDVTPPLLDYAHVECVPGGGGRSPPPTILSSSFATLLGRTRISAVVEVGGGDDVEAGDISSGGGAMCVQPFAGVLTVGGADRGGGPDTDAQSSSSPFASLPLTPPREDREHMVGGLKRRAVGSGGGASDGSSPSSSSPPAAAAAQSLWRRRVNQWLFVHAPSWYVAGVEVAPSTATKDEGGGGGGTSASSSSYRLGRLSLRRRVKALHFAVTGGTDRRASYVEHTWGQRTPILWFGDVWVPSIRPITAASEHPRYKSDKFGLLSFRMSRVWELIYRDYYCGGGGGGGVPVVGAPTSSAAPSSSSSSMTVFDATADPITYDDAVGAAFKPLDPTRCVYRPSTARSGREGGGKGATTASSSPSLIRRLARFGPRKVAVAIAALRGGGGDGGAKRSSTSSPFSSSFASSSPSFIADNNYDWYIRLWDDNYYFEENLFNIVGRMDSDNAKVMIGKIGWRNMGQNAVYPFAGGGAGWFLSKAAMGVVGPSFAPPLPSSSSSSSDDANGDEDPPQRYHPAGLNPTLSGEEWFMAFRDRKDIFMKHGLHNEDVFLTAWYSLMNVTMWNVPGVEHVSPGMWPKQRCMSDLALYTLRWEGWAVGGDAQLPFANSASASSSSSSASSSSLFYDYPVTDPKFLLEAPPYSYAKPLVWHYMSPSRLAGLERVLYGEVLKRQSDAEEGGGGGGAVKGGGGAAPADDSSSFLSYSPLWGPPTITMPKTASDKAPSAAKLRKKTCYAGVPLVTKSPSSSALERMVPPAGGSIFEQLLSDPPLMGDGGDAQQQ